MTNHCPTDAVCPSCLEGCGHWDGEEFQPTIEAISVRATAPDAVWLPDWEAPQTR